MNISFRILALTRTTRERVAKKACTAALMDSAELGREPMSLPERVDVEEDASDDGCGLGAKVSIMAPSLSGDERGDGRVFWLGEWVDE